MARRDVGELVVYSLIVVYTFVFSYFIILKHSAFRTYAWDLGINNQIFWSTLNQGKLFYYTPELYLNPSGSYFGLHFSPALFLLLPVYAIYQAPQTLLVFQSFIIALAALPLYWLARESLNNKLIAVTFSLVYLLYPPIHGVTWFDFHVQAFLPLFFFLTLHYLKNEKWAGYFTFIVLALAVAESVSTVVLFIGLYTFLLYRRPLYASIKHRTLSDKKILVPLITIMLAIVWLIVARWIQDTFFPINPNYSKLYRAVDNWSVLGIEDDPMMMPLAVVLNPYRVLEALTYDAYLKLAFLIFLFGPLLFFSFRSGISIITIAWLGPVLLSNYQPYYLLGTHYPVYVAPFIFAAAVDGMKKHAPIANNAKFVEQAKNLLILVAISSLFISPLSPLLKTVRMPIPHFSEYTLPSITEHEVALHRIIELVPPNASVLTQNNIFPHVSSKLNAYVYPLTIVAEYAPEEMEIYTDQLIQKSEYILVDSLSDPYTSSSILQKINNNELELLTFEDGIYLYKKNLEGPP